MVPVLERAANGTDVRVCLMRAGHAWVGASTRDGRLGSLLKEEKSQWHIPRTVVRT
jgi:hypothetical protein